MYKLQSLREYLLDHVPTLRANPDKLQVYVINQGSIICAAEASGGVSGFQYKYQAAVLVTDCSLHADTVIVPVLEWVAQYQPDLLLSIDASEHGIHFESDIISHDLIDLQITLHLTERVTIDTSTGVRIIQHHTEPQLQTAAQTPEHWQIIVRHPDGRQTVTLEWQATPVPITPQP